MHPKISDGFAAERLQNAPSYVKIPRHRLYRAIYVCLDAVAHQARGVSERALFCANLRIEAQAAPCSEPKFI